MSPPPPDSGGGIPVARDAAAQKRLPAEYPNATPQGGAGQKAAHPPGM